MSDIIGFIAQTVKHENIFKSIPLVVKKYDLIPYDGSFKKYKTYHITFEKPSPIDKLKIEKYQDKKVASGKISKVSIFSNKIVFILDNKNHITIAEGDQVKHCLNENKSFFEDFIGSEVEFNDLSIIEKQIDAPNVFAVDEDQIRTFYEHVNHHKGMKHIFQCFKKDDTATSIINVTDSSKLVGLCKKYVKDGICCLSVNPWDEKRSGTDGVKAITNIPIDVDVKKERKVDGVSTEEDKHICEQTANAIIIELEQTINLRTSMFNDSGNGYHILIPVYISLEGFFTGENEKKNKELWHNSDVYGRLVALEHLLNKFNNDVCTVDCISKDIARRVKIPGTWNIKPEIPNEKDYRMAKILELHGEAVNDAYVEGNTDVFNGLIPYKKEELEHIQNMEIPVDETLDLNEILQTDLKSKHLFEGNWRKYNYKSRSEAELSLAVILLSNGLSEQRVRHALERAGIGKWKGAPTQYKDLTIRKAKQFVGKVRAEKQGEVIETLSLKNLTVELLNPSHAWNEIKCYDITDDFALQPLCIPLRGEREIITKKGEVETKYFEKMGIVLLCNHKDETKEILYPQTGYYHSSTIMINGSKYKVPSEPFSLKSLPSFEVLSRFLENEHVDGREIWKRFKEYRQTYLDVGEDDRKYICQTAWDLGTHFHMLFNAYPYQDFFGFRGSGKNRSHEICNELCFHSYMVASSRSISSVFRSIDAMGSTWLKNEAESLIGRNKDTDLLELCLEGYKKGSSIPLTSDTGKDKNRPPLFFDVYSAKSFASDKDIYGAFGTRMIKYLQQQTSGQQGKVELDKELGRSYRDDAYLLRLQDGNELKRIIDDTSIDELVDGTDLKLVSRDREVFFPLLIITRQYASKDEYDGLLEFIKDYLEQQKQSNIDSPVATVLRAVYSICLEDKAIHDDGKNEFWVSLYDVRKNIIFDDPEAWRLAEKEGNEEKEIIKTSETARFFTSRKIGVILGELGFNQKKRSTGGNYQRKIDIGKVESKANTLNISLKDIKDHQGGYF